MGDFFAFKRMITPVIIQILFWLGVIGCILGGVGMMVMGVVSLGGRNATGGIMTMLTGVGILILGPLVVRIYCEIMIVLFRMNETMTDISKSLTQLDRSSPK